MRRANPPRSTITSHRSCPGSIDSQATRTTTAKTTNATAFRCGAASSFTGRTRKFCGAQGRIRTSVARKERQIYSLLPLTARPPVHVLFKKLYAAERVDDPSPGVARNRKSARQKARRVSKRDSKFPQKTLRETGEPGWVTAAGVPAAEASQRTKFPCCRPS
jgi:hypothetical protein